MIGGLLRLLCEESTALGEHNNKSSLKEENELKPVISEDAEVWMETHRCALQVKHPDCGHE